MSVSEFLSSTGSLAEYFQQLDLIIVAISIEQRLDFFRQSRLLLFIRSLPIHPFIELPLQGIPIF